MKIRPYLIPGTILLVAVSGLIYFFTNESALAVFLAFVAFCSILWAVVWNHFERYHDKNPTWAGSPVKHGARVFYSSFSLVILAFIYMTSLYVSRLYIRPRETTPYFLNTDYHFLYNSGIAFTDSLVLYSSSENIAHQGLYKSATGGLVAHVLPSGNLQLSGHNFSEPVFQYLPDRRKSSNYFSSLVKKLLKKKDDSVFVPVNIPFNANIASGFIITNGTYRLTLHITETDSGNFLKAKPHTIITGDFQSTDEDRLRNFGVGTPYNDHFTVDVEKRLRIGYSVSDLLMQSERWTSHFGETRQILFDWLDGLGKCYLLVRHSSDGVAANQRNMIFFPSTEFLEEGYSLQTSDGAVVTYSPDINVEIPYQTAIYCAFANDENAIVFSRDASSGQVAMNFKNPAYFPLHPRPNPAPSPGSQYVRALYNHHSGFFNCAADEGYLLHESMRRGYGNNVNAYMTITAGYPGSPLQYSIFDNNNKKSGQHGLLFSLASDLPGVTWLYGIRDFSNEKMTYATVFWCLTMLFLLTSLLLIFFPEKSLARIEPVVCFVLYGLIFTRMLMLWRIATFPPAEGGRHQDLENYTGFESIHGLSFTGICLVLFFFFVFLHRTNKRKTNSAAKKSKFGLRIVSKLNKTPDGLVIMHGLILAMCGFIGIVGPHILAVDIVSRVASILIPVCSYLFVSRRLHVLSPEWKKFSDQNRPKLLLRIKEVLKYSYDSRETLLSVMTLVLMLVLDRGFGVLFLLFLLLKTIAISFGRRPYTETDKRIAALFYRGQNYWIYGVIALVIYLIFLVKRNLFHEALLHYRILIVAIILYSGVILWIVKRWRIVPITLTATLIILLYVPVSWNWMDKNVEDHIKHVKHRASLIYMPIDSIISRNSYNSFAEKKILETAESQWFINSYLNKPYDPSRRINFRPYYSKGVNLITQTRDVVLTRFVIAELGNGVMMLLLILFAIPLTCWFVFYRLYDRDKEKGILHYPKLTPKGYSGMMAMILLFTIALFVWLTATNRFVFFGQDFPFLALASRMSVVFPLALLIFVFNSRPRLAAPESGRFQAKAILIACFLGLIAFCIFITGRSPGLNERNFTVRMKEADSVISGSVCPMLVAIQDTMNAEIGGRPNIYKAIAYLRDNADFQKIVDNVTPYTASILHLLTTRPANAFQPQSPIFLRYDEDQEQYELQYNRNLFLELPSKDESKEWAGSVYQWSGESVGWTGTVKLNNSIYTPPRLPFLADGGTIKVALLPAAWFPGRRRPLALVSVTKTGEGKNAVLHFCDSSHSSAGSMDISDFAQELIPDHIAYSLKDDLPSVVKYEDVGGKIFAANFYINGSQRMIYPLQDRCFWVSQYAQAMLQYYKADSVLLRNAPITLDYDLTDTVAKIINQNFTKRGRKKLPAGFRFAVIAADGDGNVRLMSDYAQSRQLLDPNDHNAVAKMERDNFFIREIAKQREQWGNMNLIHMGRGPGSSIKPIIAAAVASEVNAGWQNIRLVGAGPLGFGTKKAKHLGLTQYAGLDISSAPWVASESGEFSPCSFTKYIYKSINLYHSLFLFLGSYPKSAFQTNEPGNYSLLQLLTPDNDGQKNITPILEYSGRILHLPSYSNNAWPISATTNRHPAYFGNNNSVLAQGLATNFSLLVGDQVKNEKSNCPNPPLNIGDPVIYDSLLHSVSSAFLWSYPEPSSFKQSARAVIQEPIGNFKNGLQTPTRGGNPIMMTPFMMAQMFGVLATYNSGYTLRLSPDMPVPVRAFHEDTSWNGNYHAFFKDSLLTAMNRVLTIGTGAAFFQMDREGRYHGPHGTYYCYAKTGTIGSEGKKGQSRRLGLILSNRDLTGHDADGAKIYTIYFTSDKISEHDTALYRSIINALVNSETFINYMQ